MSNPHHPDEFLAADEDGDAIHVWPATGPGRLALLETATSDTQEGASMYLTRGTATDLIAYLTRLLETDPAELTETPDPTDPAPSVALEAHKAVYGDRQGNYGHPRDNFTRTAIIWTALLQHKLADGEHIDPEDVGRAMIGTKLSRDVNAPQRDNRVDMAGYALTLDRLETGR